MEYEAKRDHLKRSFRDPAGSVELTAESVSRYVRSDFTPEVLSFLNSSIQKELVGEGKLISSEIVDQTQEELHLQHPRVPFISYPAEWPLRLWLVAAQLTLELCTRLIPAGWILKDATPLNILFRGTTPVFIDVLSVENLDSKRSTWTAYAQFTRTFLLPMLAYTELGWPLQTALLGRDGLEPEQLYRSLTLPRRLRSAVLSAITLPVLTSRIAGFKGKANPRSGKDQSYDPSFADPEVNKNVLLKRMLSLHESVDRIHIPKRKGVWSAYEAGVGHYSEADTQQKQAFVRNALLSARARSVLDIGCNTGTYSMSAAETGASVVSIDSDQATVERLASQLEGQQAILPLCIDFAHPTPSTGWDNGENASFLDRAKGHFDTIFMLAVLHHLLISSQIPMDHIAGLCAQLRARNLIVEWVPPEDPKFIEILRGRAAIYKHVTLSAFHESFSKHFRFGKQVTLSNGRSLFHLERDC